MVTVVYKPSFADAKLREDVLQDLVGGDLAAARDRADMADHLADLLAQKVCREPLVQPLECSQQGIVRLSQRLGVAAVRDDGVAVVERLRVDRSAQRAAQGVKPLAGFRREAQYALRKRPAGAAVEFVHDGQQALLLPHLKIGCRDRVARLRGVEQADDDPRPGDARQRAFDAHAFEPVLRRADTRRVEEPELHAVDVGALLDDVARRPRDVGDQSPFLVEQAVQQG